jgi:hypothetical protein
MYMDNKKENPVKEGMPSRATEHPGSTTQGGSNFGQGSSQLGKDAIHQGEQKSEGSDYKNESGWNNEALRSEDLDEDSTLNSSL